MLGRTNTGGGGGVSAGLKIVGNPRPKNPTEGIVWVNTDVDITGYFLSAEQPENLFEGNLWIKISNSSSIKVGTPLGKDYITIMLNNVSQYVGSAWVDVEAKSFQNGVWVDWYVWDGRLFDNGDICKVETGGWNGYTSGSALSINGSNSATRNVYTNKSIDFSNFNILHIKCNSASVVGSFAVNVYLCKRKPTSTNEVVETIDADKVAMVIIKNAGTFSIELSGITEPVWVVCCGHNSGGKGTISKIWCE